MGQVQSVLGEWADTHEKICKILSCCLVFLSLCFIITGAVLISKNSGTWDVDNESFEEASIRQSRYSGGIALVMLGLLFLFGGVASFCFAFQLKFLQKAVAPTDNNRLTNEQQPYPTYSGPPQPYQPMPQVPPQPPPYSE
ncbi:unnamed protein product [Hydatigera taeniaeformis]|uniref:Transmembrane protein n=1 Tax=Hydatigena taeniaeformis TaxID=6205 RepID=A0A0R3WRK0_HYDTA|nr:unnamed protein product [Hydatigera taeniaeformis]